MNTLTLSFMCLAIWIAGAESKDYKWCCKSAKEATKCETLAALRIPGTLDKPFKFNCVQAFGTAACVTKLKDGSADVMILDAGDVQANKEDLNMVAVENVDDGNTIYDGTGYYALAVVKKDADAGLTLKTAVDYNTCHTGVGKTAGWNMPMGWFIRNDADPSRIPSSCAPGARNVKYNSSLPKGVLKDSAKWCALCIGEVNGTNTCKRDQRERYYGYDGAFQCLKTGNGQVAFIKHTTVPDAEQAEYRLLCPDGSRKNMNQYRSCNIAHVPAHAMVARETANVDEIFSNLQSSWDNAEVSTLKFTGGKDLLWGSKVHNFIKIDKKPSIFLKKGNDYFCNMEALTPDGIGKNTACGPLAGGPK